MKDGSEEMMPLFWLQWLHADCDVWLLEIIQVLY